LGGCFDLGDSVSNDSGHSGSGFANSPPSASTTSTSSVNDNASPIITGKPGSVAVVGSNWSFTPGATDPDGDKINFKISNKPVWAEFNDTTGRISGMPQMGHEGNYNNIQISASDGKKSTFLPEFSVTVMNSNSNSAPVISGNPPTSATIGEGYMFQPMASDADGDRLTFEIANRPDWANFNTTTGRLSGTPINNDSAFYSNIVISVRDGQMMSSLPAFTINVSQIPTGSVTLNWTPPTQNEDNTVLTDLTAYKIYYGLSEGNYTNQIWVDDAGLTSYIVDNLVPDTYYFVSTSINSNGIESDYSNVMMRTVN
jgi:hypothetical protein